MRSLRAIAAGLTVAVLVSMGIVVPAQAASSAPTTVGTFQAASANVEEEDYFELAVALRDSDLPREVSFQENLEIVQYDLDGITMQLPYWSDGEPFVPPTSRVKFGAVWWSVYVEFSPAEQAALAAGSAGTIFGALTKNPIAAGIATTIVSVAKAEGICPRRKTLRIYLPSFLMSECR